MKACRTQRIMIKSTIIIEFLIYSILITSCNSVENSAQPVQLNEKGGYFFTASDGSKIFIREYRPEVKPARTIFMISGITGINHKNEEDIINILSCNKNRIVVVHPRGTGYSEGERGDTDPNEIIEDYCEIIKGDSTYLAGNEKIFLFGHSMSCAFALEVAVKLPGTDGLILVNPPYKLKPAKGMSPGITDYLKYVGYFVFARHSPVVNMAGDPSVITDEADRLESEQRNKDPLLVKYFSMHCMVESKRIMAAMVENAKKADFPLLLLYGDNDNIVDRSGCDEIFLAWKSQNKCFKLVKGGSHGKSTVIKSAEDISIWIERQ